MSADFVGCAGWVERSWLIWWRRGKVGGEMGEAALGRSGMRAFSWLAVGGEER